MTVFQKNGIEVSMPDDDAQARQNMIVAADFMARMIQKYGKKVLAKIEEREKAKTGDNAESETSEGDDGSQEVALLRETNAE